jgi:hypothetical protein
MGGALPRRARLMLRRYTPLRRTPIKRKPIETKATRHDDGREVLTGEAWEERRKQCFDRECGVCEDCGQFAPLHDVKVIRDAWAPPIVDKAGHAHHRRARGMGGAFRDDRLTNLRWLCHSCHDSTHRPKKVVPKKERVADGFDASTSDHNLMS